MIGEVTKVIVVELIGRQIERATLRTLIDSAWLVTITGTGGIGKTALANQLIADLDDSFDRTAVMIDLTAVDHPDGVCELVASRLGTPDFASLLRSASCANALLVLDNCEHVLVKAAYVVDQLLTMGLPPKIIATSRAALEVQGEIVFPLAPLELPPEFVTEKDEANKSDAFRLLVDRASAQGVTIATAQLAAAASVCRQLDGVPLAIEIAAARLRSRSMVELAEELQTQPHGLARPRYQGDARQRSVRETVLWSVDLLDAETAAFFGALSVFAGPFTSDMAAQLTELTSAAASDELDALFAASLITADTTGTATWYRLLRPVRMVVRNELEASDRLMDLQSRWIDIVVNLAFSAVTRQGGWTDKNLAPLVALYPNIAASLRWLRRNETASTHRALKLVSVLWAVTHQRHTVEIAALGQEVLERSQDRTDPYWATAAATLSTCWTLLGDLERAILSAEEALPYAPLSGFGHVALLRTLAMVERTRGDMDAAKALYEQARAFAAAGGLRGLELELQSDLGVVIARTGDPKGGLTIIDEAHSAAVKDGAMINAIWAHVCRGLVEIDHAPAEAISTFNITRREASQANYQAGVYASLRGTAWAHIMLGDDLAATSSLSLLLDTMADSGDLLGLDVVFDLAAGLAERASQPNWADLAVTAAHQPRSSINLIAQGVLLERAKAHGGRMLDHPTALATCRQVFQLVAAGTTGPSAAVSPTVAGEMLLDGDSWRVGYGRETGIVRDSKGLRDLATLLSVPNREIGAVDLMGSMVVNPAALGVIDDQARRELDQRIRDLQEDADEARQNNDQERAHQTEMELDKVVNYLASALGLGGKHRTVPASAERARSAVTHRIRAALQKLESTHPSLAAHLHASIRTGSFCSYQPPATVDWKVLGP